MKIHWVSCVGSRWSAANGMSIIDEDFNMTVGPGHSVLLVEKLAKMLCSRYSQACSEMRAI